MTGGGPARYSGSSGSSSPILPFSPWTSALAHAVNAFEHRAEWIPIVFSVAATFLLLLAIALGGSEPALDASGRDRSDRLAAEARPAGSA